VTKRKSLSKKIRFNVFKRDNFRCAYCGESPPKVVLEVDHITPVSKGGDNGINNLLTACFDCNRGKTNEKLDTIPQNLTKKLEVLREKETQLSEYNKFLSKEKTRINRQIKSLENIFRSKFPEESFYEGFKQNTIKVYLKYLTIHDLKDAMLMATDRTTVPGQCLNYFRSVCGSKIYRPPRVGS
jgi:hypothetical protein